MDHRLLDELTRRGFLTKSAAAAAALAISDSGGAVAQSDVPAPGAGAGSGRPPIAIASANGLRSVARAVEMMTGGRPPLDAVIAGVNIVEDDPDDMTVGLGGLPNEDGVVELDASVMDGRTHKAGCVAALRNIRNPSKVARLVMERTDHVLLVGEGALRFARAHGFAEENLLTEEARRAWLRWKESMSDKDDWLPPAGDEKDKKGSTEAGAARSDPFRRTWGTINCCAVDAKGDVAGVTTTSGLGFKIAGRVGDSPIIGAGLYVDNAVGAAGSTGRGEANLVNCSSFLVVELMRGGMNPREACLETLKRIADHTEPRLRDKQGRPDFGLSLYAVAKDGRYGGASFREGGKFAIHDGREARIEPGAYLFKK